MTAILEYTFDLIKYLFEVGTVRHARAQQTPAREANWPVHFHPGANWQHKPVSFPLPGGKVLVNNREKSTGRLAVPNGSPLAGGGGAVALSMEEQRILDEMERSIAADDPRLASRLSSFGKARVPDMLQSRRARVLLGLVMLALIAAVTITLFALSPFAGNGRQHPSTPRSNSATAPARTTASG